MRNYFQCVSVSECIFLKDFLKKARNHSVGVLPKPLTVFGIAKPSTERPQEIHSFFHQQVMCWNFITWFQNQTLVDEKLFDMEMSVDGRKNVFFVILT